VKGERCGENHLSSTAKEKGTAKRRGLEKKAKGDERKRDRTQVLVKKKKIDCRERKRSLP